MRWRSDESRKADLAEVDEVSRHGRMRSEGGRRRLGDHHLPRMSGGGHAPDLVDGEPGVAGGGDGGRSGERSEELVARSPDGRAAATLETAHRLAGPYGSTRPGP